MALVAGTGLRIHAQRANPNVQHDEAWSYASAAGRLGPFLAAMDGGSATSLTGRWVPASEWQHFWQSDGLSGVGRIAPDLAAYDVHPPLYFGLLHGWLTLTGRARVGGASAQPGLRGARHPRASSASPAASASSGSRARWPRSSGR